MSELGGNAGGWELSGDKAGKREGEGSKDKDEDDEEVGGGKDGRSTMTPRG